MNYLHRVQERTLRADLRKMSENHTDVSGKGLTPCRQQLPCLGREKSPVVQERNLHNSALVSAFVRGTCLSPLSQTPLNIHQQAPCEAVEPIETDLLKSPRVGEMELWTFSRLAYGNYVSL